MYPGHQNNIETMFGNGIKFHFLEKLEEVQTQLKNTMCVQIFKILFLFNIVETFSLTHK